MKTWPMIDPHVHCRDEAEAYKATIASTLKLASSQGVDMIFDMPNTARPVTNRERVYERLSLVPKGYETKYRLYVGLTGGKSQLQEALWCYNNIPEVIGLKTYAGKSVGDLSVIAYHDQRQIYWGLTLAHFRGVLAVHCERESYLQLHKWNPSKPISHTIARPSEAEYVSVFDQIQLATETRFSGHLHICHVSCPESVSAIADAKASGMRISCGVTPHHILWDASKMEESDGLLYKMNPPLRYRPLVEQLRHQLLGGMIDVVETDHAPHADWEKFGPPYLSGYPSLTLYRDFVEEILPGLGVTENRIKEMTYDNVLTIFDEKLAEYQISGRK